MKSICFITLLWFVLVPVLCDDDQFKPLGPISNGLPETTHEKIRDFLQSHQQIPHQALAIPPSTQGGLLNMETTQENTEGCSSDGPDRFQIDPALPKPDFFVVGLSIPSAKEIISKMLSHPQIGKPKNLDPGFFSFPTMSAESYQNFFTNVRPGPHNDQLYGDFSLSYLYHPLAPKRIAAAFDNPKVIIVLRNPIDRAYSHYLQLVSKFGEDLSFEGIVNKEFAELATMRKAFRNCFNNDTCNIYSCLPEDPISRHDVGHSAKNLENPLDLKEYLRHSLLFRSLYDDMVERWMKVIKPENLLVLFHEDFYYNPAQKMNALLRFLQLSVPKGSNWALSQIDESEIQWDPLNDHSYDTLVDFLAPFNDRLFQMIDRADTDWKYHRSNVQK